MGVEVKVQQGRDLGVDDEDDIAATAAVTAVGPAERDELLAVDAGAAVTAVAGTDMQATRSIKLAIGVYRKQARRLAVGPRRGPAASPRRWRRRGRRPLLLPQ